MHFSWVQIKMRKQNLISKFFVLLIANGTIINVHGRKNIHINLDLTTDLTYSFYVCDISCAILKIGFLQNFNLKFDLRESSFY